MLPTPAQKNPLLPCFWTNKFDLIVRFNLIVRFMYEDDVTTS